MGAEALCRGAAEVVGIEKSAAACSVIAQNWQKVAKADQRFRVLRGDVVQQLQQLPEGGGSTGIAPMFDLVYFDPPYASKLYSAVLNQLVSGLSPAAEIAVEYSETYWQPQNLPPDLEIVKAKRYGSTHLVFLKRTPD